VFQAARKWAHYGGDRKLSKSVWGLDSCYKVPASSLHLNEVHRLMPHITSSYKEPTSSQREIVPFQDAATVKANLERDERAKRVPVKRVPVPKVSKPKPKPEPAPQTINDYRLDELENRVRYLKGFEAHFPKTIPLLTGPMITRVLPAGPTSKVISTANTSTGVISNAAGSQDDDDNITASNVDGDDNIAGDDNFEATSPPAAKPPDRGVENNKRYAEAGPSREPREKRNKPPSTGPCLYCDASKVTSGGNYRLIKCTGEKCEIAVHFMCTKPRVKVGNVSRWLCFTCSTIADGFL